MKIFSTLLSILILICGQSARASVNQISYKVVFNRTTCLYDVFMTIKNGNTTSVQEQEAYTAQVTLVVPTGTTVGTAGIVSNEPRTGAYASGVLTRSAATPWINTNAEINNPALPGYDVYSFIPSVANAYYGALNTNDNVLLFSIPISTRACGSGIRLWNNNTIQGAAVAGGDPTSASFGGLDFNNGHDFTSSTEIFQAYTGNGTSSVTRPSPTVSLSPVYNPGKSYAVTSAAATGSTCGSSALTYAWSGPGTFSSTTPNISISPLKSTDYGTYSLAVSDVNGCAATAATVLASPAPLPVKLISFGGAANKCTAMLNWETADEVNFDRFDIQYSADGKQYATVGQVSSKKNPNGSTYSFSYNQTQEKGYYRLKMADYGGTFAFSQTALVTTACDKGMITVLPNPTTGAIKVTGINSGDQISVLNLFGQVVRATVATGSSATVDISQYAPGVYNVLVVQNQVVIKTAQIVRQ